MPQKNKKGGNKARGQKSMKINQKRELEVCDNPLNEYGQVLAGLGDRRLSVMCWNQHTKTKTTRVCHIRGSMKRCRMNPGDWIMVSLREDETNQNNADIVHKYFPEELEELREMGEIPEDFGSASLAKEDGDSDEDLVDDGQEGSDGD